MELDIRHWQLETFRQRVTRKEWRDYLLGHDDKMIYHGRLRTLKAKKIFGDVYEISKVPLVEKE